MRIGSILLYSLNGKIVKLDLDLAAAIFFCLQTFGMMTILFLTNIVFFTTLWTSTSWSSSHHLLKSVEQLETNGDSVYYK